MSIRAAVIGAKGRMGSHAVEAINEAEGLELVATLGSNDSLETLLDADIDVAVELTVPKSTEDNVTFLVEHGIDTVVGTTGWDNDRLARLEATAQPNTRRPRCSSPRTSRSGRCWPCASRNSPPPTSTPPRSSRSTTLANSTHPSGTANHTAQRIAAARSSTGLPPVPDSTESDPHGARGAVIDGIHVHAIRQQGMNAHEEIHFGSDGEALTIRTDSHSTSAFMPGIVTAVRSIADYTGLIHGLENMLDL
jgi:4-hydroxy-tetrahydrodipicolinate reductase